LDKGLEALSVQETAQLLSRLGLSVFLTAFKERAINGATLRDMNMVDIEEISPRASRVECKLLLRIIRDMTTTTQISLLGLSTENEGLLEQLNTWFPGRFRAAVGTPLYAHDDTTVVQATHKTAGEVVAKVIMTHEKDRYNRAKREINLYQVFHKSRFIVNIIHGFTSDATPGVPGTCVCIFPYYKRGTVETLLKDGKPEFTTKSNGISCLLCKHAVDMAKDVLSALDYMHG